MKPGRLILILAGLLGIMAFFLPFMTFEKSILGVEVVNKSMSGYTALRTMLDNWGLYDYDGGKVLTELLGDFWNEANSGKDYLLAMGLTFALLGPIIFLIYAISYVVRGLLGKPYSSGFIFTAVYIAVSWLSFMFLTQDATTVVFGKEIGLKFEFLEMVSIGFWLTMGSMFLAMISYFFKEKKAKLRFRR